MLLVLKRQRHAAAEKPVYIHKPYKLILQKPQQLPAAELFPPLDVNVSNFLPRLNEEEAAAIP